MTRGNYIIAQGEKAIGTSRCMLRRKDLKKELLFFCKTSIVAKGYAQRECSDYNEVFSPIVELSFIRILLALVT